MRLIDVTLPFDSQLPLYPGDPPLRLERYRTIPESPYEVALCSFGTHTGTHVDAPRHFVPGGGDVAGLDLQAMCGRARVLDLRGTGRAITAEVLRSRNIADVERLIFRTADSPDLVRTQVEACASLTADAARYLVEATPVRLVGIDALSIETDGSPDFPAHHALLEAACPVVILEGLDLREVPAGEYTLWCLPLPLRDADGSPARVLLAAP